MARVFYVTRPRVQADLAYRFKQDKSITPTRRKDNKENLYTEKMTAASRGYIFRPAIFLFDLTLAPSWGQTRARSNPGEAAASRSFSLDYGFDGTLLRNMPYVLNLRANRGFSNSVSSRSLNTTQSSSSYGADLSHYTRTNNYRLDYLTNNRTMEGFYPETTKDASLKFDFNHMNRRHFWSINASHDKNSRSSQGQTSNSAADALSLSDNLQITGDRRVNLSSLFTANRTASQTNTTNVNVAESLNWRHTPAKQRLQISSHYTAGYTLNLHDGTSSETMPLAASVSLSHKLYDNLLSTLVGSGSYVRFTGGNEKRYGANLAFNYIRSIPWGSINLALGSNYQVDDRTTTSGRIYVSDEPLVFDNTAINLLVNKGIDLPSIHVFNAGKTIEYDRDFDYIVTLAGGFVRINRIIGGRIKSGDRALVSYTYDSAASVKTADIGRSFGAGLSLWSVFNIHYSLSLTKADDLGGEASTTPLADDSNQQVTAKLDFGWSTTSFDAGKQKRVNGYSSRRWQITQSFSKRFLANLSLAASGTYGRSVTLDSGITSQNYSLNFSGGWQPSPYSMWQLEAFQTVMTTNDPLRTESSGVDMSYVYLFRLWSLDLTYSYALDRQPLVGSEHVSNTLNLKLSRAMR
ncbi:MAG: hypothetical protein GXP59_02555 [Deltaproteobacteria bacterium]|nr:hypothetical protein [Deltaproteobacteria bacterium]